MEELTTAESMVMKTIWDYPHEMALQEIMKLTNETYGKDWKSQTVSTYIAKLVKKGFLRMNQSGRNATYEIIIPELSYQQEQSRKFVKFWNRGSVAQFLTAFYKDHIRSIKNTRLDFAACQAETKSKRVFLFAE